MTDTTIEGRGYWPRTTTDRAYEAAARELAGSAWTVLSQIPASRDEVVSHAKRVVTAFLTAMGQEVQ